MATALSLSALTLAPSICEVRLTLETGVAVSTTDQLAKTTVYATPATGNHIALYNGTTSWALHALTTDLALPLGTKTANLPYDVFCYDNAGNATLEDLAWTNATTRATPLGFQDGVLVQVGARTRRYLGTYYTVNTTTIEDSVVKRCLYNQYNQRPRAMTSGFVSDWHAYTTNAWQEWHAGTNSTRLQFILGQGGPVAFAISAQATVGAVAAGIGQGVDITNNPSGLALAFPLSNTMRGGPPTSYADLALGFHFIAPVEFGSAGDTFLDYSHNAQLLI
jgi:hypothetical protein